MDLTTIPQEDGFTTKLAQEWNWEIGTMTLQSAPNFTMPSGETCYVVVQPNGANAKLAEFDSIDTVNNTINITNVTLLKGAGINNPTGVTYPTNTEVLISDSYQFWEDIKNAINSKAWKTENNTFTGNNTFEWQDTINDITLSGDTVTAWLTTKSLTTAQRLGLTATNWMIVYDSDLWAHYQYIGWAWSSFATGSVENASETVAGKIELATNAEMWLGTSVWGSWARLVPPNDQLVKTTAWAADENKIWVLNASGRYDDLVSTSNETTLGLSERATDTEAQQWTDTERYVTPKQVKDNYGLASNVTATLTFDSAPTTLSIAHGLSRIPTKIRFDAWLWDNFWVYWADGASATQRCSFTTWWAFANRAWITAGFIAAYNQSATDYARWAVSSVDASNINLSRTWDWSVWTTDVDYAITCEI